MRWALGAGISEAEGASILQQVRANTRLRVVGFNRRPDGSIAVLLADKPERPHGVVVVFKKIGERWEEDPRAKDEWIR